MLLFLLYSSAAAYMDHVFCCVGACLQGNSTWSFWLLATIRLAVPTIALKGGFTKLLSQTALPCWFVCNLISLGIGKMNVVRVQCTEGLGVRHHFTKFGAQS